MEYKNLEHIVLIYSAKQTDWKDPWKLSVQNVRADPKYKCIFVVKRIESSWKANPIK